MGERVRNNLHPPLQTGQCLQKSPSSLIYQSDPDKIPFINRNKYFLPIIFILLVLTLGIITKKDSLVDFYQDVVSENLDYSPIPDYDLNDPNEEFTIREDNIGNYMLHVYNRNNKLEYNLPPFITKNQPSYYVGESKVDLEPYVGKTISIKGHFAIKTTDTQCMAGRCHKLFSHGGKASVVNIDAVSIKP